MTAAAKLERLRRERDMTARGLRHREGERGGLAAHLNAMQTRKLERLEREIAELEKKTLPPEPVNLGENMSNDAMPGNGMILAAGTTLNSPPLAESLGLPTAKIPRGTPIPESLWPTIPNLAAMLSSGALRWVPPTALRPARPAAAPSAPTPVRARDHLRELAAVVSPLVKAGKGLDQALDLVDRDMVLRALATFTHRPGQGAAQRSPNGFRAHLARLMEAAS